MDKQANGQTNDIKCIISMFPGLHPGVSARVCLLDEETPVPKINNTMVTSFYLFIFSMKKCNELYSYLNWDMHNRYFFSEFAMS